MMRNKDTGTESPKQKFVLAALDDILEYGVTELSMRRVAGRCGMSSGAAYRHFSDRNELMLEVFRYINEEWENRWRCLTGPDAPIREKLEQVSVAYVEFLCGNPVFQTIITINDASLTAEQREEKAKLNQCTEELIGQYCDSVGMDPQTRTRKTYAVRAFIYGAALMINSGQLPADGSTLAMIRQCISREFDLP